MEPFIKANLKTIFLMAGVLFIILPEIGMKALGLKE
jgi:hypothetical protein